MSVNAPLPIIINNSGGTSSSGGSVITTDPGSNTTVVNNDVVNINTNDFQTTDNIFDINYAETGTGVTKQIAGLSIHRGTLPEFKIVFNENTGIVEAGLDTGRDAIAQLPGFGTFPDGAIPAWNSSTKKLSSSNYISSTAVTNIKNLDQKLNTNSNPQFADMKLTGSLNIGGQTLNFPISAGLPGYVLTTDGAGNLSWTSVGGGGGGSYLEMIVDSTTTTRVTTEQTAGDKTIRLIADNVSAMTATKDVVSMNNGLQLGKKNISISNYNILSNDLVLNYIGLTNGTFNLPDVTIVIGKVLVINNKSSSYLNITNTFGQNILGSSTTLTLYPGETVKLISDGTNSWT